MKSICFVLLAILSFINAALCMNGFAVTLQMRGVYNDYIDEIVKFAIENNNVVSRDVLFKGRCGKFEARPVISFDGKKVAFASRREGDAQSSIFVIDSDGKNLKPIVTPAYLGCSERTKVLDWPAGPYVYYKKSETEMYRVHIDNPSDNKLAVTLPLMKDGDEYKRFRKWSVSADLKRSAIQWEMNNVITNYPLDKSRMNEPVGGCNIHLSAGGYYFCSFGNSGHSFVKVSHWHPGSYDHTDIGRFYCRGKSDGSVEHMGIWAGTHEDVGQGMDWPRWSTNSDKWLCLQVGRFCPPNSDENGGRFMGCGSNQVLLNWKDKQAIVTTDVQPGGDLAGAGDLWVKPPAGVTNAYESADGKWVQLSDTPASAIPPAKATSTKTPSVAVMASNGHCTVRIGSNGRHSLEVVRVDGARLVRRSASGIAQYSFGHEIGSGLIIARITIANTSITKKIPLR